MVHVPWWFPAIQTQLAFPPCLSNLFLWIYWLYTGQYSAKPVIQKYLDQAGIVDFAPGALDIDTPEEWGGVFGKKIRLKKEGK